LHHNTQSWYRENTNKYKKIKKKKYVCRYILHGNRYLKKYFEFRSKVYILFLWLTDNFLHMKLFASFLVISLGVFISISSLQAGFFDSFINTGTPEVRYCNNGECGLEEWIDVIKWGITDLETTRTASQYIQDIVIYLLTFVSIIAVIYIIYAGFQILIWWGDEEKMKSSKQTIIYVIIGMILMWLAWPITQFILSVLS